jgi:hypothetical protein
MEHETLTTLPTNAILLQHNSTLQTLQTAVNYRLCDWEGCNHSNDSNHHRNHVSKHVANLAHFHPHTNFEKSTNRDYAACIKEILQFRVGHDSQTLNILIKQIIYTS